MKNKLLMPVISLCLVLSPVLIITLASLGRADFVAGIMFILALLFPVAGLTAGVMYITKGKEQTCRAGKIIAVISISLPVAFVALIIIFFIGASTGLIPLM